MSVQAWFLRHGEAVPHDAKPDDERELTPRGERQAEFAGRGLARLGIDFSACYSSPKLRAMQTAERAADALGVEVEELDALTGDFDRDDLAEALHGHDDGERVLLVGHEPDFSQIVRDLTGARIDLKKGGVAAVTVDGPRGELLALLRPRELEALALGNPS